MKKGIGTLHLRSFPAIEDTLQDMQSVGSVMEVLAELTKEFMDAFAAEGRKNLIDYNDLEHFALRILIEENEGEIVPTKAAIEL